jgi:diamine N-acetyltransferase
VNERRSPSTIHIEPARPEHVSEIVTLASVIWRAHYPGIISPAQIEYMLARMYDASVMRREMENGIAYERLLVNGALRGFASYGAAPEACDELKLYKLYMHPGCQRQGLGTLLLHHVESVARARGCKTVALTVNRKNATAIAAYRKHGFAIRESIVTDIGGGFVMDDHVMAKHV